MFNVVLVSPEIPPNTGNVIRLCANTGAALHLVEPLGFPLDDARMRRAGLDYHEFATMRVHRSWDAFIAAEQPDADRVFAFTTRGSGAPHDTAFAPGDWLVFGSEARGLPDPVIASIAAGRRLRLPMRPGQRSLNLSNAVAVAVFEAWRQHGFAGAAPTVAGAADGIRPPEAADPAGSQTSVPIAASVAEPAAGTSSVPASAPTLAPTLAPTTSPTMTPSSPRTSAPAPVERSAAVSARHATGARPGPAEPTT